MATADLMQWTGATGREARAGERARTMRDDLRDFSGEQLLMLAVMSNRVTRVLIDAELRRRAATRPAPAKR